MYDVHFKFVFSILNDCRETFLKNKYLNLHKYIYSISIRELRRINKYTIFLYIIYTDFKLLDFY